MTPDYLPVPKSLVRTAMTAAPPEKMTLVDLVKALQSITCYNVQQAEAIGREAARRLSAPALAEPNAEVKYVGDGYVPITNEMVRHYSRYLHLSAPPAPSADEREELAKLVQKDISAEFGKKKPPEGPLAERIADRLIAAGYRKRAAQGARVKMLEATAKINLAALVLARDTIKVLERYAMHNPSCPKFKLKPGKCTCGLDDAIRGKP